MKMTEIFVSFCILRIVKDSSKGRPESADLCCRLVRIRHPASDTNQRRKFIKSIMLKKEQNTTFSKAIIYFHLAVSLADVAHRRTSLLIQDASFVNL